MSDKHPHFPSAQCRLVSRIGLFITLGVLILIGFLGSVWWRLINEPKVNLTLYFRNSVHGIDVGAPVKILGVAVGQVESLGVRLPTETDPDHYAEVHVVLNGELLAAKGLPRHLNKAWALRSEVERGLRARLQIMSPMTGVKYVELAYIPKEDARFVAEPAERIAEVPTLQDPLSHGLAGLSHRLAEMEKRDFAGMEAEIMASLGRIESAADPEAIGHLNDFSLEKLGEARAALTNPRLRARLAKVGEDIAGLRLSLAKYDAKAGTGAEEISRVAAKLREDLEETAEDTDRIARALDPRSPALLMAYTRIAVVRDNAARVRDLCEELMNANGLVGSVFKVAAEDPEAIAREKAGIR